MNYKDNKVLYINLSQKEVYQKEITSEDRKDFIGGTGINTKILYESEAMYNDALSEKNILIFGAGPAVGSGLLAGNRCTITAKSPITDLYGDSNVGGRFSTMMRSVGFDNIVVTGKSNTPTYVFINKVGEIQFFDATEIWSLRTDEVTDFIENRHGKHCTVASIGPAGANLVRFSNIIIDKKHAAGRMGMGCVMGSKNLKAIVIEGDNSELLTCNLNKVKRLNNRWIRSIEKSVISTILRFNGTLFLIKEYNENQRIIVKNCKTNHDEEIANIYAEKFKTKYETNRKACNNCTVACSKEYEIKEGKYKGEKGDRLDYGSVISVGSNLGVFDWSGIIHLKILIDHLGLDTIELSGVLALVLECQERGFLSKEVVNGKIYKFGNVEDIEELIYMLVNRKGIGNTLAEGTYRAANILNVSDYIFCIKKSMSGPLSKRRLAWALGYITSTRGGDHLKNFPFTTLSCGYFAQLVSKYIFNVDPQKIVSNPEDKGRIVWWHENYKYIVDAMGLCAFAIQGLPSTGNAYFQDFADIMNAMYEIEMTDEDVFRAAERIYQLQNSFNINCGLKIEDYRWPERKKDADISDEYIEDISINNLLKVQGMLLDYFLYRGLTVEGKPTTKRFLELGLNKYIERANTIQLEDVKLFKERLSTVNLNAKIKMRDKIKRNFLAALIRRKIKKTDQEERNDKVQ